MSQFYQRIDKLKDETVTLRMEVKDLKETLVEQNDLIISLLMKKAIDSSSTNEVAPKSSLISHAPQSSQKISEFTKRFPLECEYDLLQYENNISDENKEYNINIVRGLLTPKGIIKSLTNILSDSIIMEFNVDGHHNKKRLLSYPKFIGILYDASYKQGLSMKDFLKDLRRALKMSKNRCHKNACMARKKLRIKNSAEQANSGNEAQNDLEDDKVMLIHDVIKMENLSYE